MNRRRVHRRRNRFQWAVVGVVALLPLFAQANAYKVLCVKGAKASGMGEAFVAQADDPSAVTFNPAGLPQVDGTQVNAHLTAVHSKIKVRAADGSTWETPTDIQMLPSCFMTSDFGWDNVTLGFGVSVPNGISTDWPDRSPLRYESTYTYLEVVDVGPAVGWQLSDAISIGAGANILMSKLDLRYAVDMGAFQGAPGAMDVPARLDVSGEGVGGTIGVMVRPSPAHSLALTYRSAVEIDYDGDYTWRGLGTWSASTTVDFPDVWVAGYAFRPNARWTLEVDVDWTHWSGVDDVALVVEGNPLFPGLVQPQGLKNTVAVKVGMQYLYSDGFALRCGYIYDENATPQATWRPGLPDTDLHFLNAGASWMWDHWTVDLALQAVYYKSRTIDNNVDLNETLTASSVDGKYSFLMPAASVGVTYRF